MTPGRLETYLNRFGLELRNRGFSDPRIVDEARDHLVDTIEDGLLRGLSAEEAERQALVRFGAPKTVAARFATERYRMLRRWPSIVAAVDDVVCRLLMLLSWISRIVATTKSGEVERRSDIQERGVHMASQSIDGLVRRLAIVWHRKWWILVPTLLTAVMTSVVSHYFLPIRYQSEASILIVPQRVSAEYVRGRADGQAGDRLQRTSAVVMSRSILERIIAEGNLYEGERRTMPMAEVIRQMRNDISLTVKPHDPMGTDVGFKVSFVSSNPRTAQRGTERLASLFVEENLREREVETEGTVEFISAQIEDVKRQIIGYEKRFDQLLAQDGGRRHPSRTDVLEYEALQETYKTLLTKSQESKISASLERRQISEQYRVVESARLPEEPVGPSRLRVNVMGGLAGLALGLVFVGVSVRRRP